MTFYQCKQCEQVSLDDELKMEPARPGVEWLINDKNALRRYACPNCGAHFFEITVVA